MHESAPVSFEAEAQCGEHHSRDVKGNFENRWDFEVENERNTAQLVKNGRVLSTRNSTYGPDITSAQSGAKWAAAW